MNEFIKLNARPRLKSPHMVAAWPGVGNVATIVANYLKSKLDFKDLAEIVAPQFFDPIGIAVKDNVVEAPQFPQSKFYYWKDKTKGGNDLIIFIGDDQPAAKGYALAQCVLDVAVRFGVKRIYTCAAALTHIHPTELPRVWGVATNPALTAELKKYDLLERGNFQIAGLNGLLLGTAKERNVEGMCLLGEVPQYATRVPNPMAALAIVSILTKMLGISIDTVELSRQADEAKETMKQLTAKAMGEYIDLFTEPIWEQGGEETEEDGEE